MPNRPVESISRHCMNIHCRKCRARARWYRRKAWHCRQTLIPTRPGKK